MKTVDETLQKLYREGYLCAIDEGEPNHNELDIRQAKSELRELVEGMKKKGCMDQNCTCVQQYNSAISDILALFGEGK